MGGLPWFAPKFSGTKAIFHYSPDAVELPGGVVAWSLHMVSGWSRKMACAEYRTAVSRVPTFWINWLWLRNTCHTCAMCFVSQCQRQRLSIQRSEKSDGLNWVSRGILGSPRCGGCAGNFGQRQRMCLWQWVLADTWPMGYHGLGGLE